MDTYGPYPGIVRDWHDGDTCHIDLDLGFYESLRAYNIDGAPVVSCRIFGINAPELRTAAGKAALTYVQSICPAGTRVRVVSHGLDKYGGRFDGSLQLPAPLTVGTTSSDDLATLMLAAGQAVVMTG